SARDVIFTLSTNGTIVSLNKAFDEITGLKREDWIGRNFSGLIHPEDLPLAISKFENTIAGNKTERYEIRFINSEGVSLYGEILTALIWQDNIPGEILGIVRDVTERKNAEKLILNSLKEKEVLLKEIHHRVKNNLQVIISLLNMQSSELNDPEVMNSFREIQNRVVSMSLIHQSFYQSNSLSDIDFSVYIKRLAENLFKIFGFNREKTALLIDTSGIHISIDTAIPLGLLINEVLSNSLKHGFNENAEGKIYIELTENENEYILKLGDSGCGLPEEIAPGKTNSLGMTLIKMLCDQIDGKIELNLNNGTEYIVKFPSKSYKDRLDGLSA
ncbi:MAG: PAS domain S-box protein, partial [Ignavibacteria bacterium]|nr:PAS domain S-box protein [Ignavibacteria bacterium]